jgi:2-methylisocitrate lyase-like PEP mutase family enzyme
MTHANQLRQRLADGPIVVAPGVYDSLGALMAQQAGFGTLYLSGASIAYTRFGRPEIGLVGMSEVAQTLGEIRERVELALIVDADTGFGNALNVQRTVKVFEKAGAAAIQLEDQTLPKRCGHLAGKTLVPAGEMVGKIKAAVDARCDADTMIVARTDAVAVEGLPAALERAQRYVEAGADMLFVEAPPSRADLQQIAGALKGMAPLMANMVEGGTTPLLAAAELQQLGYRLVIFPGGLVRAVSRLMADYFASLKRHGTTQPFRNQMLDFAGLNELLGTAQVLDHGKRYDGDNFTAGAAGKANK